MEVVPASVDQLAPLHQVPRIGVAVIVMRNGQLLVGRRLSASHGADTWQLPGGHLEFGETIEHCAVREVAEETGLDVTLVGLGPYINNVFIAEQKHYVTLFVVAESAQGEAVACEPDKCPEWRWTHWDDIPTPRFLPLQHLMQTGYRPLGA